MRVYLKSQREITQTSEQEHYGLFKFKTREDVVKLLKVTMTQQTLNHWEARDAADRAIAKGAANICKILLDAHRMVMLIEEETDSDTKKLEKWQSFKNKFKIH